MNSSVAVGIDLLGESLICDMSPVMLDMIYDIIGYDTMSIGALDLISILISILFDSNDIDNKLIWQSVHGSS